MSACATGCGSLPRRGGLCPLCRQMALNVRVALRAAVASDAERDALYSAAKRLAAELERDADAATRLRAAAIVNGWKDTLRGELAVADAEPEGVADADATGTQQTRSFIAAIRRALRFPAFAGVVAGMLAGTDQSYVRRGVVCGGPLPAEAVAILWGVWGRVWRFTAAMRLPARKHPDRRRAPRGARGPALLAARFPIHQKVP